MKNKTSVVVHINDLSDLEKINDDTKYININMTNYNYDIIKYFIDNGSNYLYSEIILDHIGYIYVSYDEFCRAEAIIDMIYANMPNDLNKLEMARYLYISIAKLLSSDINLSIDKSEIYNLPLISKVNNPWGSLAVGRVTDLSICKIYYYLLRRLDIDVSLVVLDNTKETLNKIKINNQVLLVDLYNDIPYIQASMKTKNFATYNDDLNMDKKIKYVKRQYNDYYLDKELKNIDYTREDCVKDILLKTENIFNLNNIKTVELSIIYNYIFNKYCPNYNIKINNLYLNNKNKNHFIIISYNDNHYSYNYKQGEFVKINDIDIINNIKEGKICLYLNELIPNINI